jgi:hypothetical protein
MVSKTKSKKRKFDFPTMQFLYDRYIGHDEKRIQEFVEELFNGEIALKIYDLHTKAGLSQRELAKRAGTSASTSADWRMWTRKALAIHVEANC